MSRSWRIASIDFSRVGVRASDERLLGRAGERVAEPVVGDVGADPPVGARPVAALEPADRLALAQRAHLAVDHAEHAQRLA